jgi:hypothetical protein
MTEDFLDQYITAGGIDDEKVTFRNVRFTTDLAYRDGQVPFLLVDITPENPDVTALTEQRIGVGNGWEAADDEASVIRVDGKKAAFHQSSKVGTLLTSLGKLDEFRAAVKKNPPAPPTEAAFWEGVQGVIRQHEETANQGKDDEFTYTYYAFDTFDGWEGQQGAGKAAKKAASKKPEVDETPAAKPAKKAASKKAAVKVEEPAEEPEVDEAPASGGIVEFKTTLIAHCQATEADDHATWLVEAYEAFGDELVAGGDAFQALVDDEDAVWGEVWNS